MIYDIEVKLREDWHGDLITILIMKSINVFLIRYCIKKKNKWKPGYGLDAELQITYFEYVWDCINSVLSRDEFEEIQYLDNISLNSIFNCILLAIDDILYGDELNDILGGEDFAW